jgi:PBP1b-binding outer membrane lipoprotein LpoB
MTKCVLASLMFLALLATGCGRPDTAVIVTDEADKYSTPPDAAEQMQKAAAEAANQRPGN